LVATGLISICVLTAAAVVLDSDALHVHGERSASKIGRSSGPLAGSVGGRRWLICCRIGTSNPIAHLDLHWCLWEVLASKSESITVVKSAHKVAINGPFDVSGGPVDGVCVPGANWVGDVVIDSSVVGRGVALSKEVALH
jgi:hypothetical protein